MRAEKSMIGRESEVKAVRSLVKLNLEGTDFREEEDDKSLRVASNSKCLNESETATLDAIAS